MDGIKVITLYDEESDTQRDFELVGTCQVDSVTYWMVAELPEEEEEDSSQEQEDGEEDDEADESAAYLFRICGKEEAEFTAIDGDREQYVTSMMSDEAYDRAAEIFMQSEEYDVEIEEEEV